MTIRTCTYRNARGQFICTECGQEMHQCQCPEPDDRAHERLWSPEGKVAAEVLRELQDIRSKPVQHRAADLVTAVADVLQALKGHHLSDGTTADEVHRLCVALSRDALKLSLYGDSDYSYEPDAVHDREDIPKENP